MLRAQEDHPPLHGEMPRSRIDITFLGVTVMRKVSVALSVSLLSIIGSYASSKDLEWIAAAQMSEPRLGHAMVELSAGPNALGLSTGAGKVMVIGGFDSSPNSAPEVPSRS